MSHEKKLMVVRATQVVYTIVYMYIMYNLWSACNVYRHTYSLYFTLQTYPG